MRYHSYIFKPIALLFFALFAVITSHAQQTSNSTIHFSTGFLLLIFVILAFMLAGALYLFYLVEATSSQLREEKEKGTDKKFSEHVNNLTVAQIETILGLKRKEKDGNISSGKSGGFGFHSVLLPVMLFISTVCFGQNTKVHSLYEEPGVIITVILLIIPLFAGLILLIIKTSSVFRQQQNSFNLQEAEKFSEYLKDLDKSQAEEILSKKKSSLEFHLTDHELADNSVPKDEKGFISNVQLEGYLPFVAVKKKALKSPHVEPALEKLVTWYLCCAAFWLLFGTTVGEYVGIKFVSPDTDHLSWLSFGRLRPVHTNAVFWGWASMAMLGLAYYIVPRVSNTTIASIKLGWYSLICINITVVLGSICLMAGVNNGGGEYREYIWPVMLFFATGLILTLYNFLKTIAKRTTKEIYISNWYIVSAIMFVLVITTVAYFPYWQNGLGETIVQGYYMHQGVGMWFMFFTLGIVYYFLPQQLNKPIYSYSLGILAFWAQILFYTLVGTHHFVFSSIPWWLQTTAIVASIGMIIPVGAGFTNFIMTFKGAWHKLTGSYTLPFFLVGIVFYLTASLQGTAEAFRSTNLIWHFTDFTVAHSHLTMYGIISFFMWASTYALLPRLTGREAPQITIGAHFWLALIGLLFYTVPLMYGSTLKGILWTEGKPFTEGLILMAPYWLWRAIGGSLMWLSHLFFAYNIYKMVASYKTVDVGDVAIEKLNQAYFKENISS